MSNRPDTPRTDKRYQILLLPIAEGNLSGRLSLARLSDVARWSVSLSILGSAVYEPEAMLAPRVTSGSAGTIVSLTSLSRRSPMAYAGDVSRIAHFGSTVRHLCDIPTFLPVHGNDVIGGTLPLHVLPAKGREADPDATDDDFIRQDGLSRRN